MSQTIQIPQYKVTFKDASDLRKILRSLSNITEEPRILLTEAGLFVREISPSGVSMVEISIPTSKFVEYEITNDVQIAFCTKDLERLLKGAKNTSVVLSNDPRNPELIQVSRGAVKHELRTIERTNKPIDAMKLQPLGTFSVSIGRKAAPLVDFLQVLEDAQSIYEGKYGQNITVIITNGKLRIRSKNDAAAVGAFIFKTTLTSAEKQIERAEIYDVTAIEPVIRYFDLAELVRNVKAVQYSGIIKVEICQKENGLKLVCISFGENVKYYQGQMVEDN